MDSVMPHKKVWECQLFSSTRNVQMVDFMFPGVDLNRRVEFRHRYVYGLEPEFSVEEYPAYICFSLRDLPKKKKDNLPDAFIGEMGLAIVSGAMRDLLQQFDLGQTRFHEMPLYEYD